MTDLIYQIFFLNFRYFVKGGGRNQKGIEGKGQINIYFDGYFKLKTFNLILHRYNTPPHYVGMLDKLY